MITVAVISLLLFNFKDKNMFGKTIKRNTKLSAAEIINELEKKLSFNCRYYCVGIILILLNLVMCVITLILLHKLSNVGESFMFWFFLLILPIIISLCIQQEIWYDSLNHDCAKKRRNHYAFMFLWSGVVIFVFYLTILITILI